MQTEFFFGARIIADMDFSKSYFNKTQTPAIFNQSYGINSNSEHISNIFNFLVVRRDQEIDTH